MKRKTLPKMGNTVQEYVDPRVNDLYGGRRYDPKMRIKNSNSHGFLLVHVSRKGKTTSGFVPREGKKKTGFLFT